MTSEKELQLLIDHKAFFYGVPLWELAQELLSLRKAHEGWKLVPVEPDWEMLSADGCKEHHNGQPCLHHDNRKRIWSAMLAASPTPHE